MSDTTPDPEFTAAVQAAVTAELARRDAEAAQAAADQEAAAEQAAAQQAAERDEALHAAVLERARWEGHTHTWQENPAGDYACSGGCGQAITAEAYVVHLKEETP